MTIKPVKSHGRTRWRVHWVAADGRHRKLFKTKEAAKTFASSTAAELREFGSAWSALPASARAALAQCHEQAEKRGYTVTEACRWFESHGPRTASRITFGDLANQCLAAKAAKGVRPESYRLLKTTLDQFREVHEQTPAADITQNDLRAFIDRGDWGEWRRRGALIDLGNAFNFGVNAGLLVRNPAKGIERRISTDVPVKIFTPEKCKAALLLCRQEYPRLLPWLVLCMFAGVRTAEAERLTWSDIKPGYIEVAGHKAKTRARRLIEIHPTLQLWLHLCDTKKPLIGKNHRKLASAFRVKVGGWSRDVLRHAWISYELARRGDANGLALEAGNTPEVIFKHYRELATKAQAQAFWALTP